MHVDSEVQSSVEFAPKSDESHHLQIITMYALKIDFYSYFIDRKFKVRGSELFKVNIQICFTINLVPRASWDTAQLFVEQIAYTQIPKCNPFLGNFLFFVDLYRERYIDADNCVKAHE